MSEQPEKPKNSDYPPPLSWSAAWIKALTQPSVETYEQIAYNPNASGKTASIWMAASLLVIMAIWALLLPGGTRILGLLFLNIVIIGMIGFWLGVLLTQLIARALDGEGGYGQLGYTMAAFAAPMAIISSALALIPGGSLLSLLLGIYWIILKVIAVKATNRFRWEKAIVASMLSLLGGLLFAPTSVTVMFSLGPSISHIVSSIVATLGQ